MRYRHSTRCTHILATPFGEAELTFSADMADYGGALAHREGDKLVVAYLSHDDDCQTNPLDDCDGMGKLLSLHRHSGQHSEVYEALGLDSYGDKDLGLVQEALDALWHEHLDQMLDSKWEEIVKVLGFVSDDHDEVYTVINKLRDELHDHSPFSGIDEALYKAERYLTCISANWEQFRAAEPLFEFDVVKLTDDLYDKARSEGRIGNVDAVVLDCYDHGGQVWSISGGGMQCQWDTARCAGVWVPDDCAKEEIDHRAPVYAVNYIREATVRLRGKDNKYQLIDVETGDCIAMSDSWGDLWKMAETYAKAAGDLTPADLAIGRRYAAIELAGEALEQYNAWSSGDVYGVIVEHYTLVSEDGDEPVWESDGNDEACWGHIGSDYAKETMTAEFEAAVKHLQNTNVALG